LRLNDYTQSIIKFANLVTLKSSKQALQRLCQIINNKDQLRKSNFRDVDPWGGVSEILRPGIENTFATAKCRILYLVVASHSELSKTPCDWADDPLAFDILATWYWWFDCGWHRMVVGLIVAPNRATNTDTRMRPDQVWLLGLL